MATTTTIYADTDANPRSGNPDTNYSGSGVMRTGQFSGLGRRHFVMSFDVSAYTNPSDIVSANLKLFYQSSGGGSQRNMKLVRLNQTFVESEVTWNSASSGVAWTGGAGGEGNGEFTQPVYTIVVGTGASNPEVDIRDLVVDAITRREGTLWLILCFDPTDTSTAAGFSLIYPSETPSTTSDPQIEVVVADRISWTGASSGDVSSRHNWTASLGVPTANDIALFNENGTNNPSSSSLTCSRCYFGRNFSQDFGSSTVSLTITADKIFADTQAQLFIKSTADEFHIRSAKQITDGCVLSGTTGSVYISNCEAEIRFHTTAAISNIYIMSGSRINPTTNTSTGIVSQVIIGEGADDANVICEGRFNVTDNAECDDISLYGGGKYVLNNTAEVNGIENLTIASGSVCEFNATEIQTALTMYGGTFTIQDNENAQLDLPTTITNYLGTLNLNNGLDSANAAAFTGTTFTGYASTLILGKTSTLTISA